MGTGRPDGVGAELVIGTPWGHHAAGTADTTLPQGTVTFLLTDVEGSTQLWERDREAMREAVVRHDAIVAAVVEGHNGVRPQEQGEGDSVVAVFAKASDAVAAAVDIQLALEREPWPTPEAVRVRMALHTGDADLRDEHNYGGEAIIRTARLRALAHGGQVLVSSVTADVVADRLPHGASLGDLGVHRLKAMGRPQRVYQLHHPELAHTFLPLRSLDVAKATVPLPATSLIGRANELVEGRTRLREAATRLVTLVGPGGCGKTRLAAQLAHDVGDDLDGVWWVELAPLTDADVVADAVMAVIGISDTWGRTPLERLALYLAGRRALLVLDNCEHVLAGARDVAAVLSHACPELTIMATSREALGLAGESVWPLPTLDVGAAVQLFAERATQARPNFVFDEDRAVVVREICQRLDGIPLAIELAAARARMLTPERILTGLDDRFRMLTGGAASGAPRQQTLRASVEWSHDLLAESEQALLRRLSVFAGGFTLDAAEQVAAGGAVDALEVLDVLGRLVDRSLVVVDEDRFRLLETIRDFAAARLAEAGEDDDVRTQHLAYFRGLAESAASAIERTADREWLARLEQEHENLRAALTWALDNGHDRDGGAGLAVTLIPFWSAHGHYWEAQQWLAKAGEVGVDSVRARAGWGLGHLRLLGMHVESAYGYLDNQRSVELANECGDLSVAARALADMAFVETVVAGGATAERFEEALATARRVGDYWAEGYLVMAVGFVKTLFTERHDEVPALTGQIRTVGRRLGNEFMLVVADGLDAHARFRRGELRDARPGLERELAAAREYGDPFVELFAAMGVSGLELGEGRMDAARQVLAESSVRLARSARGRLEGMDLMLAAVDLAEGEAEDVVVHCDAWGPAIDQLTMAFLSTFRLLLLARALVETGDVERARSTADLALGAAEQSGNQWLRVAALEMKAGGLRAADEAGQAEDVAHELLAGASEHHFRPEVARGLEILAGLAVTGESWAEGVRLAAGASAWREASGCRAWPIDDRRLRADLDLARTALGEDAWTAAWTEGAALSLEDAVSYARRARGERRRPSSGWASLTPTETDVVRLVAEGLTNPDIAARLFVSRATVKTHLVHVFSKLGVATRAELAAAVTRRGL